MPRSRCTFRARDLRKAVETAKAAGLNIGRVEIDARGKIAIISVGEHASDDDLDRELAAFEAKQHVSASNVEGHSESDR